MALFGTTLLLTVLLGCGDDKPKFEIISMEGKVEKIEVASDGTGKITVAYYSDKHQQEIVGVGLITRETEIMINGAIAKLSDLREGDRVRGQVRVEKKRGEKIQTAVKIHVERAVQPSADG